MIIKQLSIFLNNEIGRFTEVTRILAEAGVNLQAFTLSEVSDFGILRLITDNNEKAIAILQENSYAVSTTDVVYIELPDRPGTLAKSIQKISDAGISVEYMYAFSQGNTASVVIRTDDVRQCNDVISK
ncbi:MAG: amino acid-binding protein [Bacteroidaceae bacterium]|nr:amino acid-binding protein [Bacteroidaceae bacterium]